MIERDVFGRDRSLYDELLRTYAQALTSSHHHVRNLVREVFDTAAQLSRSRGPGSAAAKLFSKSPPHTQLRNQTERDILSALLGAPLSLGVGPAPLFLSEALRARPVKVRQAIYRLYRGGALEVAEVSRGGRAVETYLVVARPRSLSYRLSWGAGPFGRLR